MVDGDERLCVNMVCILESAGIQSEWCQSTGQAVERIVYGSYRLLLLGWKLQDMNGIEAAKVIRAV